MDSVKWRKVDLHIHSDASHDCSVNVNELVNKIITEKINLFSITDHNNVDNIDAIRAVVDQRKAEGHEIEFLPGIEVRTDRGKDGVAVHLLIIFPEHFTKEMIKDKFLSCDGIQLTRTHLLEKGRERSPSETDEKKLYDKGCEHAYVKFDKAIDVAVTLGAITIAAHPKSNAGIERELDYMNNTSNTFNELLINSVMNLNVMELPKNYEKAIAGRYFYLNDKGNFIKQMPSVLSSDSHKLSSIGTFFTFIKMDTLNFEGLKQILFEPRLRVNINENVPPTPTYPYISSIKTDGGYYNDDIFVLSHELNTIIGGRGSGKSTIVDLLKFTFNKYDPSAPDYQDFLDRIYHLLRFNNSVEVTIKHGEKVHTIKRICNITSKKERNSQVYIDNSEILDYKGFDIELYSQGNLKLITKRAYEQLKLIDDIGNLHGIHKKINAFKEKLIYNAKLQLSMLDLIKNDLQIAGEKPMLKKSIKEKEDILIDDKIQKFNDLQEDKNFYDLIQGNLKNLDGLFKEQIETASRFLSIAFPDKKSEFIDNLNGNLIKFKEELLYKLSELRFFVQGYSNKLTITDIKGEVWIDYYENKRREYLDYLKDNNLENVADVTNQLKEQKDKLLHIDNNVLPKIESRLSEIVKLQIKRECLLNNYEKFLKRLKEKRKETCESITDNREIRMYISEKQDTKELTKHLNEMISGLNIRLKDVSQVIISNIDNISDFKKCIKNQEMNVLEKKYLLTPDAAGKLLSKYGSDISVSSYGLTAISEELFNLDLLFFEDIIEIEILDANDNRFKKFSRFSPGQQCAYLLSILLNSNSNPLIIDQPEDELDWNYIESFIQKLRSCKTDNEGKGRQFVFVTHNQNITVLADSENILKAINTPTSDESPLPTGKIEAQGGLERDKVKAAVLSLEGGSEAFTMRRSKYGLK